MYIFSICYGITSESVRKSIYKRALIWSAQRLTLADRCLKSSIRSPMPPIQSSAPITRRRSSSAKWTTRTRCAAITVRGGPVAGHHLLIAGTVNPEAFLWRPGRLPGPTISAARLIVNTCPGAAMRSGGAIDDASSSPIPRRQGGEIISCDRRCGPAHRRARHADRHR